MHSSHFTIYNIFYNCFIYLFSVMMLTVSYRKNCGFKLQSMSLKKRKISQSKYHCIHVHVYNVYWLL